MKKPVIILFDIETLPNAYEHICNLMEYNSDRYGLTLKADVNSLLSFGYKVLGESKAYCINTWDTDSGRKNIQDDTDLLVQARAILSTADAIVTHNGRSFDYKFLNTRLVMAGMSPLPNIPHIDTCSISKSKLYLQRNRLDYLAEKLSTERKMENGGWKLWVRLAFSELNHYRSKTSTKQVNRDKKTMSDYCKQDVITLEKIFLKLRPLIGNIPNSNLFGDKDGKSCPTCGSKHVQKRGRRVTKTSVYNRYQCQECGSWSSANKKGLLV
jgi:DNA polymerase elongation subunit (family B)